MGNLVVIEGLDGSGKATQTALLEKALQRAAQKVRTVSFPDYKSESSSLVKMYLGGEFGEAPGDVNPYAASAFYAVDRYASWKARGGWKQFLEQQSFVLADRYTTSNIVHQCCKLPVGQRQEFIEWLEEFEYSKLGIPSPDLVIYLDVEPRVSEALLRNRYGDRSSADIHEADREYQAHCREVALWCAGLLGWELIQCNQGDLMKPQGEIAEQIAQIVRTRLRFF